MNKCLFTSKLVALVLFLMFSAQSAGHNLNFGTLIVVAQEPTDNQFSIVFQVSGDQGKHLNSYVELPEDCQSLRKTIEQNDIIRLRYRQEVVCKTAGIDQKRFAFKELSSNASILVRALIGEELKQEHLLTGDISEWKINLSNNKTSGVLLNYSQLGVKHILIGWDHLLFLCMLMLLVAPGWKLVQVITAFTIGHSITLVLASLDLIKVPIQPTEALIALSILFLAAEVIRYQKTQTSSITLKYPGLVSAAFGLFHGLGFASVLGDYALAKEQVLWGLLGFNVGVEIGQLLFVSIALLLVKLISLTKISLQKKKTQLAYLSGSFGAFWLIERVAGF